MSASARGPRPRSARRPVTTASAAEVLEERVLLAASPVGGVGNNVLHPDWGAVGVDLLRTAPADYADGVSSPAGGDRPSAREISNAVADSQGQDVISDRLLSAMIYAWGQFIDHDIDLTPAGGTEPLSIPVPAGDPTFDPTGAGTKTIDTTRSEYDPATGTSASNPRQQVNSVTAFLDGSMVYGSDAAAAAALRTFSGGTLKTSAGNLLPNDPNSAAGNPTGTLFLAGDVRANENVELTSLQTLFVREHNSWAGRYARQNPTLTDQQLYDKARARVIAEIQSVTYNQWLPALLGKGAIDRYAGYDPSVNPGIANEFSTAAFRFGHSLLGDDVEFLDDNGQEVRDEVSLADAFFNPDLVRETGVDPILKYLASDPSSEVDTQVVDSVRNFLIGGPGGPALDLASLNIERGRDHGLADYNTVREAYGLPRVTRFSQITSDAELAAKLEELYGSVDDVDLWVGGLAEDHVPGGSAGETFRAIISDQFERLRDGDRFWYQNQYSGAELRQIENTSLSDIIRRNTGITNLQQDPFFFRATVSGAVFADANGNGRRDRREGGAAWATVQLIDSDGEVVATTLTDSRGGYRFGVADRLRTGTYQVRVIRPDGTAGPTTKAIAVTRGDQAVKAPDLALSTRAGTPTPRPGSSTPRPLTPPPRSGRTNPDGIAGRSLSRPAFQATSANPSGEAVSTTSGELPAIPSDPRGTAAVRSTAPNFAPPPAVSGDSTSQAETGCEQPSFDEEDGTTNGLAVAASPRPMSPTFPPNPRGELGRVLFSVMNELLAGGVAPRGSVPERS